MSEQTIKDKLYIAFDKERKEVSSYINENIISKMNQIDCIPDVQVHVLSQRQKLVDRGNELKASIRKKNENLASVKKTKYRFYKLEFDIKLSDFQIRDHIEADIEESSNIIKMIENQISFYKDTTETLDKCIWMIKYLIEVEKYKSGTF